MSPMRSDDILMDFNFFIEFTKIVDFDQHYEIQVLDSGSFIFVSLRKLSCLVRWLVRALRH